MIELGNSYDIINWLCGLSYTHSGLAAKCDFHNSDSKEIILKSDIRKSLASLPGNSFSRTSLQMHPNLFGQPLGH